MAATVKIYEWNTTSSLDAVDKTSGTFRFKAANNSTVDTNNPITRPASGFAYSYEKWARLRISVAPSGSITNLALYSGGSFTSSGVGIYVGRSGVAAAPVVTASTYAVTDFFTYTSGSPLSLNVTNTGPFSSVGDIGDFAVLQSRISSVADFTGVSSGSVSFVFAWDET